MNKPHSNHETETSRREFLKKAGLGVVAGSAFAAFLAACKDQGTSLTAIGTTPIISSEYYKDIETKTVDVSSLTTDNNALQITLNVKNSTQTIPAYVVRLSATSYEALSDVCTHQGYNPPYNQTARQFGPCPGHGSIFNQTGGNVSGPAPYPLQKFNAVLSGTTLTVSNA